MIDVKMTDIMKAYSNIKPFIKETPLIYSDQLSKDLGAKIWFKMESFQETGSFKLRGALNNIMSLSDKELKNGVVTVSSGNHAKAVAYAAKLRGISAVVCVPESSPISKREGILGYGAELVVHGPTYEEADMKAHEIERETGRKFIHSYEAPETIAGQGTVVMEALLKEGDFDIILVPAGGGGLLCGTAIAAKAINPKIKVYGLQTNASAPWYKSFYEKRLNNDYPFSSTCADGLEGKIGWPTVELSLTCVDGIIVVDEQMARRGIKWMAEKHHYMIEGASATCIAALLEEKIELKGKKILSIITGGNIDLDKFCDICRQEY